jgi:predicted dehydrogenase
VSAVKDGEPVGVALIGSGRMGSFHGQTLARRISGTRLVAVADPAPDAAERLAAALGADRASTDPAEVLADPAVDAVVIAAPARFHADTLIHDFDALRFLNPGAEAAQVYASASALVEPDWRDRGLLDTAVVVVRFDNGAVGVAEACFEAAYGYDVRGEVLGSDGMATMGDGRRTGMVFSGAAGRSVETVRSDQELLADAYVAELTAFVDAVRAGTPAPVGGDDARAALAIALAAAESVRTSRPVGIGEVAR